MRFIRYLSTENKNKPFAGMCLIKKIIPITNVVVDPNMVRRASLFRAQEINPFVMSFDVQTIQHRIAVILVNMDEY